MPSLLVGIAALQIAERRIHACLGSIEMNDMKTKFENIPQNVIDEISFMFGSTEECMSEYLNPILIEHGYEGEGFLLIEPEDDIELVVDIYERLFLTGIRTPFEY